MSENETIADIELKPCPFCGVVPEIQDFTDGLRDPACLPGLDCKMTYAVGCENENCKCTPFTDDDYPTPQAAAEAWNRRADGCAAALKPWVALGYWLIENAGKDVLGNGITEIIPALRARIDESKAALAAAEGADDGK